MSVFHEIIRLIVVRFGLCRLGFHKGNYSFRALALRDEHLVDDYFNLLATAEDF